MSADSVSDTPIVEESGVNKRGIIDTSFDQSTSPGGAGPAKRTPSTDSTVITRGILVTTLDEMFERFERNLDVKFDNISSRLDSIDRRLNRLEEEASSRDIRIENVLCRVDELELKGINMEERLTQVESGSDHSQIWHPVGLPETNVLLLGDSNSGGKIRFGEERGTLGRALPGTCEFRPKLEDLPAPDSPSFRSVSDIVISVGTNNLKTPDSDPESLVKQTYNYVKSVTRENPGTHVFHPGVLPVHAVHAEEATNVKIKLYNHFLKDMCKHLHTRTTFVDVNMFCTENGSLKQHLSNGESDPLHLNDQGIKLFASRLKHALRYHHNLPSAMGRVRSAPVPQPEGGVPPPHGRRGGRVSRGSRGGRWTNYRGRHVTH